MPMTPQQALTLITNIEAAMKAGTAKPDVAVKAANRIAFESIRWALNAQKRDTMLLKGLNEVRAAAGLPAVGTPAQAGQVAQAQAPMAQAAVPSGVPRGPNGLRLNEDGTEMDADQSAREDMMDAAINGAVQAGEIQPGHTAFTPPAQNGASPTSTTHDGTPVTVAAEPAPAPAPPAPSAAASARQAAMDAAIAAQRSAGAAQKV